MKHTTSAVGQQASVGRPEPATRDVDDEGTVRASDGGRAVDRAGVGDDRAIARRHAAEDPRQGLRLIEEARPDDVDGRRTRCAGRRTLPEVRRAHAAPLRRAGHAARR
jgi:hypothetical protein